MSQIAPPFPESLPAESSTLITNRWKILMGALVLAGALGYLAFIAFQSATVYYYTVGELQGVEPTPEGKVIRVSGRLVPDSFIREDDSTLARFQLTDGTQTLYAAHEGVLPGLFFNENSEIILEGTYRSDGAFESQNVIVKCPSKYIAAD